MKNTVRPLKSYHLLYETVAHEADTESTLLARAVRRAVCGFVDHSTYVNAAHAAATSLSPGQIARRLQLNIETDANPIAALSHNAGGEKEFQRRWNAFNRLASLGVRTIVGRGNSPAALIERKPQAGERDVPFRADLSAHCVELLSSQAQRDNAEDPAHRLLAIAKALGISGTPVCDLIDLLYTEPGFELDGCARLFGCSPRTLQRGLSRHELTFALVKQAVRLTIAGFRLRNLDEPVTLTAQAAGFFDSAHLNHAWRTSCDISPSVYRALARNSTARDNARLLPPDS